jgi:hypothetical protein
MVVVQFEFPQASNRIRALGNRGALLASNLILRRGRGTTRHLGTSLPSLAVHPRAPTKFKLHHYPEHPLFRAGRGDTGRGEAIADRDGSE